MLSPRYSWVYGVSFHINRCYSSTETGFSLDIQKSALPWLMNRKFWLDHCQIQQFGTIADDYFPCVFRSRDVQLHASAMFMPNTHSG